MTMSALGAAAEYEGQGITGNSLWPATVIESQASKNFELGGREMWRKAWGLCIRSQVYDMNYLLSGLFIWCISRLDMSI